MTVYRRLQNLVGGGSSFLRGVRITLAAQSLMIAINICTGVLAARLLGPRGRGEFAVVTLWSYTLSYFVACGINQSIVYFTGKARDQVSEVATASCVIGFVQSFLLVGLGLIVLPRALKSYRPEVQHLALVFLAATPFLILGGYPGNILQGLLRFRSFNLIRMLPVIFYAAGLAVLAVMRDSQLSHVVACQIVGLVLALVVGCSILWSQVRLRWAWSPSVCNALVRFGAKTQLGNVSTFINKSSDQLVLSLFVPPRDLGLYVVAGSVSFAIMFLPQALGIATLAQASNEGRQGAARIIGHSVRISVLWLGGAAVVLFVCAPMLITRVFGPGFAGASLACRILLPGAVALGMNQVLYEGAFAMGYPALPSYAEFVSTIITVVGLITLLPLLGFVGAAIVSTVAYVSSCVVMLGFYQTKMHIGVATLFRFRSDAGRIPVAKLELS